MKRPTVRSMTPPFRAQESRLTSGHTGCGGQRAVLWGRSRWLSAWSRCSTGRATRDAPKLACKARRRCCLVTAHEPPSSFSTRTRGHGRWSPAQSCIWRLHTSAHPTPVTVGLKVLEYHNPTAHIEVIHAATVRELALSYHNYSHHTAHGVSAKVALPPGATLLPESVCLYRDGQYTYGTRYTSDTLSGSSGLSIGNYAPGSSAYVTFSMVLPDVRHLAGGVKSPPTVRRRPEGSLNRTGPRTPAASSLTSNAVVTPDCRRVLSKERSHEIIGRINEVAVRCQCQDRPAKERTYLLSMPRVN